jgi:hypothetical protein
VTDLRIDSRWWYWVAAVPVVTAFWVASALWIAGVVLVVPEAGATATGAIVSIPAVALGVPALVAYLAVPLAFHMDKRAIGAAGGELSGIADRAPPLSVLVDLVLLAGVYRYFEGSASALTPDPLGTLLIAAGVTGGTWLAVRYLRARRAVVAMPSSFRDWRRELRETEKVQ